MERAYTRLAVAIVDGDAVACDQRGRRLDDAGRGAAHDATFPSRISITRSARAATRSEWVTSTTVLS
jgi:hypothetical protein